jgi:hypothetical protein
MNKFYILLAFSFSSHFAKAQTLPVDFKNALQEYFLTLPQTTGFDDWIASIKKDSTIILDTIISNPAIDSFYFYMRCISKSFIAPITDANYNMVIMARKQNLLSKNTILMIAQMEYYLDTSENSKLKIEKTYRELDKKFRNYFSSNLERKSKKKNNEYATNNYYLKGEYAPILVIQRGRYYKDKSYSLIITLYYTLSDFKNIS